MVEFYALVIAEFLLNYSKEWTHLGPLYVVLTQDYKSKYCSRTVFYIASKPMSWSRLRRLYPKRNFRFLRTII